MISQRAFTPFLGFPLIMYGGILTLLSIITTVMIGVLTHKGYAIPFKRHTRMAIIALLLGLIHGVFGLSFFFHF